jgi:hypothetical protein
MDALMLTRRPNANMPISKRQKANPPRKFFVSRLEHLVPLLPPFQPLHPLPVHRLCKFLVPCLFILGSALVFECLYPPLPNMTSVLYKHYIVAAFAKMIVLEPEMGYTPVSQPPFPPSSPSPLP